MKQGHGICHLKRVLCCKGQSLTNTEKGQVTTLFTEEGQDLGDTCFQKVIYKQGLPNGTPELQLSVPARVWTLQGDQVACCPVLARLSLLGVCPHAGSGLDGSEAPGTSDPAGQ